jgi:acetyl-CoA/propionyl-CoA carboxylase biotin carboxyl carrier protein
MPTGAVGIRPSIGSRAVFESVLIANRGEIARRVIRTLRRLGVRSVAVYAPPDRDAPFVREADDAIAIASYLDVAEVVEAAVRAGAQALHPGYGFLSENPALARACADAGVVFVGPPPEAMEAMGDKITAKAAAERAGVPVVPSYTAETVEFPVLVKAAAGGGGRGMRVVERPEELEAAMAAARREARAGFGDDRVFLERYLPRARHIEVQVIGDRHGTIRHLGERECSLQRRHQKVVEEAPSPVVDAALRERLGEEAVALAAAVGYTGAGTVEFIADFGDPREHYFLEMNARLQVEHPVTELVTGVDLVELQLRVAAGERLPDLDLRMDGHAIEVRLNAEDAAAGFLPAAGRVLAYRRPGGAHVRVDDAIEAGSVVGTDYDSMIAKVIAHGPDRPTAIARLDRALAGTAVLGVTTTTAFLRALLAREEVRSGAIDTGFIEREQPAVQAPPDEEVARAAALLHMAVLAERTGDDPFERVDGWRPGGIRARSWWRLAVDGGAPVEVVLDGLAAHDVMRAGGDVFAITEGGERREWTYAYDGDVMWIGRDGHAWRVRQASSEEAHEAHVHGDLRAPMPGQVLLVPAAVGDRVSAGDPVVVLESMKMELSIAAPVDGTVAEIGVAVGDRVTQDQSLARVEAE